jgi:hypothetical protein
MRELEVGKEKDDELENAFDVNEEIRGRLQHPSV